MQIRIRYFAAARELASCAEEQVVLAAQDAGAGSPGALSQEHVRALVAARHPALAPHLPRMRLAINGDFAATDALVRDGDEVVLLPPVAGGSGDGAFAALRAAPITADEALAAVAHPSAGGIDLFVGVVRDHAEGHPVARLEYEAYPELALLEMGRVLAALRAERPEVRLAAIHRVGSLEVGDVAVIVAASAPHRAEAFEACRAAIDRIKATVPIWKKEWAPDGSAVWVNLEPGTGCRCHA